MRILGSFVLFIASLVFIGTQMNQEVVSDTVETKLGGIKRDSLPVRLSAPERVVEDVVTLVSEEDSGQEQEQVTDPASEENEVPIFETQAISEPDPEAEWQQELKNLLIRLEPENGEAIFEAYINESNNHKMELDALHREQAEPSDELLYELDRRSEARMEEILGPHSEEVNQYLSEYFKALKHQTRAPAETGPEL